MVSDWIRVVVAPVLASLLLGCSGKADPAALASAHQSLDAAQAAIAEDNLDDAIPLLTAAIESGVLAPDDAAAARIDRAICLARMDMFDLAHKDLDNAAARAPLDRVHVARSFVYEEEGKASEAEAEFDKARQLNPSAERMVK